MNSQTEMYQEAQTLANANKGQEAIDNLDRLLIQYPNFSPAHIDLGELHHKMGNPELALEHYQQAVALESKDIDTIKLLADYQYVELQDVQSALATYKKLLDIEPNDVDALTIAGNLCLCEHRWDEAEGYYQRVQEIEPWRFEIQEYLEKLASCKESPIADQGPDVVTLYQNSQDRVDAGDLPGAIESLEKIIEIDPDYALAYNDIGVIYFQMGEKKKALKYYRTAVQMMPDNHVFLKNVADYYLFEQGDLYEALPIYSKILNEEPSDIEVLMTLGTINIHLNRLADAKVFFNRVLDIEPWNNDASQQLERLQP